jgi:activator of HSP90 ATPase
MNKAIEQKLVFKNTTAQELFDIYTDPVKHGELLDAEVIISAKEGATFSCFNGNVTGKNLLIIPNKMIVQSWRGNVWEKTDMDSVLTLVFSDVKGGAQIHMVHSHTPDQFTERWKEFYWQPLKEFLRDRKR